MKKIPVFFLGLITMMICVSVFAASNNGMQKANSAIGKWLSIDTKTQKATGIVEITERDGILYGKIIKGFDVDPIKYCHNCPGKLRNAPVVGLTFLWGFSSADNNRWTSGYILDPHEGKTYRGALRLIDHEKKLQLRGYWGVFFQTQTWIRNDMS